jgi:hypothetical protein
METLGLLPVRFNKYAAPLLKLRQQRPVADNSPSDLARDLDLSRTSGYISARPS